MSMVTIRLAEERDRLAIHTVEERAFERPDEAGLVERLVCDGDTVLELVAERGDAVVGHVLFSRLHIECGSGAFSAVALAPVAVDPAHQRQGIGQTLITEAHKRLQQAGETLAVVVGEPAYYARFGYTRERARHFSSDYQCEALQALAWNDAPAEGRLAYAAAFAEL
jgi:putative acetyltransferase